jgi:hypothetical protein
MAIQPSDNPFWETLGEGLRRWLEGPGKGLPDGHPRDPAKIPPVIEERSWFGQDGHGSYMSVGYAIWDWSKIDADRDREEPDGKEEEAEETTTR